MTYNNFNKRINIHLLFWALFIVPYILLKLFFYNTGWIGIFIIFYLITPLLFVYYFYLLTKETTPKSKKILISLGLIFVFLLVFIFWDLYEIIKEGFNFRMI